MVNCMNCANSKVDGLFGDMSCKLKKHFCEKRGEFIFIGKVEQDGKLVDCDEFRKGK